MTIDTLARLLGDRIGLVEEGEIKAEQPPGTRAALARSCWRRRSMSMDRDYQSTDKAYDSINSRLIVSIGIFAVAVLGFWMLLTML